MPSTMYVPNAAADDAEDPGSGARLGLLRGADAALAMGTGQLHGGAVKHHGLLLHHNHLNRRAHKCHEF